MPLELSSYPPAASPPAPAPVGPRGRGKDPVPADPDIVLEAPNCTRSGLERGEWLAYYAAWIHKIDRAVVKYAGVSLMGDSRGSFQEPTWLVEGIIQEEKIRWERPTPSKSSRTSRTRLAG